MKVFIIVSFFYSFTFAQLCDDIYKISHTKSDTNIVKNRTVLIGDWQRNEDKSTLYNVNDEIENTPSIEIRLNSIKYISKYLHTDSSYYKATLTGMWFIEDNVFRISGTLLKESKEGKSTLKREEKKIEYCTVFTYSNGMLCFEGLTSSRFHDGPVIESECFEKK